MLLVVLDAELHLGDGRFGEFDGLDAMASLVGRRFLERVLRLLQRVERVAHVRLVPGFGRGNHRVTADDEGERPREDQGGRLPEVQLHRFLIT